MDHPIGFIVPPSSLDDDGAPDLISYRFLLYFLVVLGASGWVLSEFYYLLFGNNILEISCFGSFAIMIIFFSVVWGGGFAPHFRGGESVLLEGRTNSQSTADFSIGLFPLFAGHTDCILHIDQSIQVVNGIEFLLLIFGFGPTFWLRFGLFLRPIALDVSGCGLIRFHNVTI